MFTSRAPSCSPEDEPEVPVEYGFLPIGNPVSLQCLPIACDPLLCQRVPLESGEAVNIRHAMHRDKMLRQLPEGGTVVRQHIGQGVAGFIQQNDGYPAILPQLSIQLFLQMLVPDGTAGIQQPIKFLVINQSKNIMLGGLVRTVVIVIGQTGKYRHIPIQTVRLGNGHL